jgi:hypothetical protein
MANTITRRQGCGIQYLLKIHGYTYNDVATLANRSDVMVTHFLVGRKGSEPVKTALCKILGYKDFGELLEAIPQESGTQTRSVR